MMSHVKAAKSRLAGWCSTRLGLGDIKHIIILRYVQLKLASSSWWTARALPSHEDSATPPLCMCVNYAMHAEQSCACLVHYLIQIMALLLCKRHILPACLNILEVQIGIHDASIMLSGPQALPKGAEDR